MKAIAYAYPVSKTLAQRSKTDMSNSEKKAATLWSTMREIVRIARDLGYYAHLSDSFGCWYEITFRSVNDAGSPDRSVAGYRGIAKTQNLSPISLSDHVPADIRAALSGILVA